MNSQYNKAMMSDNKPDYNTHLQQIPVHMRENEPPQERPCHKLLAPMYSRNVRLQPMSYQGLIVKELVDHGLLDDKVHVCLQDSK